MAFTMNARCTLGMQPAHRPATPVTTKPKTQKRTFQNRDQHSGGREAEIATPRLTVRPTLSLDDRAKRIRNAAVPRARSIGLHANFDQFGRIRQQNADRAGRAARENALRIGGMR